MMYRKLSKDENGQWILKEAETISLTKELFADSKKVDSANDKLKIALETVTHWQIEEKISSIQSKIDEMLSNDVSSVKSINDLKKSVEDLKNLDAKIKISSVENWYIGLACAIARPKFVMFNGEKALVTSIIEASKNGNYKAVREELLNFGKNIIPTSDSGIKPKKPAYRLQNSHDGKYSIEELVAVCTARKPKITKKGLVYTSPSDSDIFYNTLVEVYYNSYNLPIKGRKSKKAVFERVAF